MHEPFFVIGLVLLAGFVANIVFERTRVSQVLILIALGFLLGPVFNVVDAGKGSVLASLTPFVGALALIILLFDGGITLNVFELARALPTATAFTITVFALSAAAVAALASLAFGWSVLEGMLLGGTLGGTSSAIVIAMLEKAKASSDSRALLVLESTITDALSIITAFVALQLIKANAPVDASTVLNLLASAFSIALLVGAVAGVAWVAALQRLGRNGFPYALTLAVVFLVYAFVEAARGNGSIAVFAFGLVLGNAKRVAEMLKLEGDYALESRIAHFQEEVTFFTRTFFFVFLGLILSLGGLSLRLIAFALAAVAAFLFIRWLVQKWLIRSQTESRLLVAMLPRGLAAAVLAGRPSAQGLSLAGFTEIALLVIIFTNVIATLGVLVSQPARKPIAQEARAPRVVAEREPKNKVKPDAASDWF